jgi:hypothetical protein
LLAKVAAQENQLKGLADVFNHNTQVYNGIFSGVEAVHSVLQETVSVLARGEKLVMKQAENGEERVDFGHYLKQYQGRVQTRLLAEQNAKEEAEKSAVETAAASASVPEGATVFGGTDG